MNISAPTSGIQTSITRHDITAHDIANINTPGFEERTPHQVELNPQGVRIGSVTRTPNRSSDTSNTDLVEESKEQIQNKHTLTANTKVLKAKDQMLGEVIDLVG